MQSPARAIPTPETKDKMNMTTRILAGAAASMAAAGTFAAGALSVTREVIVDRPAETVWKLVGEFNSLDVWLPPVIKSTYTGTPTQPGAIRVLKLAGDASVTEKLISYENLQRSYSYAFVKSPLPVKNYVAMIQVSATVDGRARVTWTSTFDAAGAPDDQARQAILGIYDAGLGKLGSIFRN
jgi:mxaD protein